MGLRVVREGTMRLVCLVLLSAVLVGCGSSATATPTGHLVLGSITLNDSEGFRRDDQGNCHGDGGYSDIDTGTQVTVKDQGGTLIGTGSLATGVFDTPPATCTFDFTLRSLPDVDFYSFEVGRRGAISYSATELVAQEWKVEFTLGN